VTDPAAVRSSAGGRQLGQAVADATLPPGRSTSSTYDGVRPFSPGQFCQSTSGGDAAAIDGETRRADVVPNVVAGAALTAFSAGLLGLYLRSPGMREEGSLRPTQQGMSIAKDVWMFGIGLTLLIDGPGDDEY
jgi:hypothetical protein